MKPTRIERSEIWRKLELLSPDELPIFARILPDDVAGLTRQERERLADDLERLFIKVPGLTLYSRTGMFDFLGLSNSKWKNLMHWTNEHGTLDPDGGPNPRWGFARPDSRRPGWVETLLLGTNEAAVAHPDKWLFELGSDQWVRPIAP